MFGQTTFAGVVGRIQSRWDRGEGVTDRFEWQVVVVLAMRGALAVPIDLPSDGAWLESARDGPSFEFSGRTCGWCRQF